MRKFFYTLTFFTLLSFKTVAYPDLIGAVVDEADILSNTTEESITQIFEQENITNIVIATVVSLEGKSIEQYATDLGNHWGIGSFIYDNGAILLIAPNEGGVRIATGIGMQEVLTNDKAYSIIQTQMMPYLKKGDFDTASIIGAQGIVSAIRNNNVFPNKSNVLYKWILLGLFILSIVYVMTAPEGQKLKRLKDVFIAIFILFIVLLKYASKGDRYRGGGRFGGGGASGKF